MNWSETRKKLLQLAARRETRGDGGRFDRPGRAAVVTEAGAAGLAGAQAILDLSRSGRPRGAEAGADPRPDAAKVGRDVRAYSLCVASGKGGTGKSVTTASLATLISARGRTLILDADLGVGNAHILQDVSPPRTCVDVVEGRRRAREVLVPCSGQLDLLAGGSGVPRMADLSSYELHLVGAGIDELEPDYRYLLVDSAAGVSNQTLSFARACDLTLIVTTPDLTSMTDAYAFLKVLTAQSVRRPLLLVNRARDEAQAEEVTSRIRTVCDRFLGMTPRSVGWVPDDPAVMDCVNRRGSVTQLEPAAPAAQALRRVAVSISEELGRHHPAGMGRRLLESVGFRAGLGTGSRDPV